MRLPGAVPLDRLMSRYGDYDLFVLPTQPGEGIPRVLLEAMANGLPVIATNVSGIGSLITNEVNGLLIEEASADTIAAAITRVVRDADLRRRLIQGGYATARAHTLEQQAAEMMEVAGRELALPIAAASVSRAPRGAIT